MAIFSKLASHDTMNGEIQLLIENWVRDFSKADAITVMSCVTKNTMPLPFQIESMLI